MLKEQAIKDPKCVLQILSHLQICLMIAYLTAENILSPTGVMTQPLDTVLATIKQSVDLGSSL